ncbi:MAG: hypothetical protein ABSF44_08725 [Candidatus Bathyarchaeia archaeon]|jgi:hypothetical protein
MRLLFKEAIETCFHPSEERSKKLNEWVKNANSARDTKNADAKLNQYDKAEELITFYTFAPLVLSLNRVGLTNRILGLAGVSTFEEEVVDVALERQYRPPKGYLKWIRDEVKNHPVKYIREQANAHKANQPLESNTHVDAFIETDKLLIFFEIKFTSDISHSTTFNPCRNQLARLIDVGLDVNEHNGKEVLVILSTPRRFFEKKSRLYYYKIAEYAHPEKIKEDIEWRSLSTIKDNVLAVRWIALGDLIDVLYKDFEHKDKEEALEFFKERNLSSNVT